MPIPYIQDLGRGLIFEDSIEKGSTVVKFTLVSVKYNKLRAKWANLQFQAN